MDAAKNTSNNRATARSLLLQVEKSRRTSEGRDLYWDAKRWEEALDYLILGELNSDLSFTAALSNVPLGSKSEIALEERIDQTIQEDIDWYEKRLKDMQALLTEWAKYDLETTYFTELRYHIYLIERRLNARKLQLLQFEIETLERRRRYRGGLAEGLWASYIHKLKALFQAQEKLYLEAEDESLQEQLQARLEWLYSIRATQQETLKLIGRQRFFDHTGFRSDKELLNQTISLYEAPPPSSGGIKVGVVIVGALVLFAVISLVAAATQTDKSEAPQSEIETSITTEPIIKLGGEASKVIPGTADELNTLGINTMARYDYILAEQYFQAAINADPNFHEPYNNLAFCLYERGEIEQAIELWRKAIELAGNRPDAHAGLGMALYQQELYNDGWLSYQRAIDIDAGYRDADWLRSERLWSERAIQDSIALRLTENQ